VKDTGATNDVGDAENLAACERRATTTREVATFSLRFVSFSFNFASPFRVAWLLGARASPSRRATFCRADRARADGGEERRREAGKEKRKKQRRKRKEGKRGNGGKMMENEGKMRENVKKFAFPDFLQRC
jgi:hypothetical protein